MILESKKIYGIVATVAMTIMTILASRTGSFGTPVVEPITEVAANGVNETKEASGTKESNPTETLPKIGIFGMPSPTEVSMLMSQIEEEMVTKQQEEVEAEEPEVDMTADGISMANASYVATLIESEAGNVESEDGRVAVALTAFKRTESDKYPDTLPEVVEQPYQYADLVGYYSDESYDAAVKAIRLWEEGSDETVLPDGYMYFFGYKRQNWFYRLKSDGSMEIYALPGQTVTDDVRQAFRKIVLKEVPAEKAETEVQEAIESVEAMTEETNEAVGETANLPEGSVAAEATTEIVTVNDDTVTETISTPSEDVQQMISIDAMDASSL